MSLNSQNSQSLDSLTKDNGHGAIFLPCSDSLVTIKKVKVKVKVKVEVNEFTWLTSCPLCGGNSAFFGSGVAAVGSWRCIVRTASRQQNNEIIIIH
jgi:hypothetical protein